MARPEGSGHPEWRAIVAGARACVGTRFRPQGRGGGGLDCLGVVIAAAAAAGIRLNARCNYVLGCTDAAEVTQSLAAFGLRCVSGGECPGDVLISFPASGHVHFAVLTDIGLVEAHVGLRRVIERPMSADDAWQGCWRLPLGDM